MIKVGMIFQPTDKRRDATRIKVDQVQPRKGMAICVTRKVGQKTWAGLTHIRLDRLEGRHYKLVKGV